jgi:hypothetical protein
MSAGPWFIQTDDPLPATVRLYRNVIEMHIAASRLALFPL